MKKLLSIILTLLFLITLIGCAEPTDKKGENSKPQETLTVEKTESIKKNQVDKQVTVTSGEAQEVLSAEDKAVKAEIAKYNKNAADFRSKKQEKLGDKTYDLVFDKVGYTETREENADIVTYIDSNENSFVYNSSTGKLRFASFYSNSVEKDEKSIDISDAEKIAYKYASQVCDISKYKLSEAKEIFIGYSFIYNTFVDGYKTSDKVRIHIGFSGEIVYIGIFTDTFDGIDLNINKDWIEQKTNEALAKHEGANAELKDQCIVVEDGKPCLQVVINYESTLKNKTTKRSNVYVYAFEE